MKITIAPDSFKGSLSARQASDIIRNAITDQLSQVETSLIPMSDGGEGMLDSLIETLNGQKIELTCHGPLGNKIKTYYGGVDKKTAIIETAKICGLTLVPVNKRNPENTTTFGVGEVIIDAIDRGFERIIIGIGGSATNDGGYGMLNALGLKGFDKKGNQLSYYGADLYNLAYLDWLKLDQRLENVDIIVANDVNNILCGEKGASFIYGKQKGATQQQIKQLDQALFHFAKKVEKLKAVNLKYKLGSGAAGGLGYGLLIIGAQLIPGAKLIADALELESEIASTDLVITGEGKSDEQTLNGKVPIYLSKLAKKYNKPIILISGSVDNNNFELTNSFTSVFSIINEPMSIADAIKNAEELLYNQMSQVIKLIKYYNLDD
ncbi:MAG TPA: glycerate kinase [Pseudogracilibacillus sp.]|nr:glycerate kinase [Pseudogracilibacillus sp.]